MKKVLIIQVAVVFLLLFAYGCVSVKNKPFQKTMGTDIAQVRKHPQFNKKNIIKLKIGMSLLEFEAIFGLPDSVESGICGRDTGKAWPCLTYTYRLDKVSSLIGPSTYFNYFTFDQSVNPPLLNDWKVNHVYLE